MLRAQVSGIDDRQIEALCAPMPDESLGLRLEEVEAALSAAGKHL
jgi:hypothetical protein